MHAEDKWGFDGVECEIKHELDRKHSAQSDHRERDPLPQDKRWWIPWTDKNPHREGDSEAGVYPRWQRDVKPSEPTYKLLPIVDTPRFEVLFSAVPENARVFRDPPCLLERSDCLAAGTLLKQSSRGDIPSH